MNRSFTPARICTNMNFSIRKYWFAELHTTSKCWFNSLYQKLQLFKIPQILSDTPLSTEKLSISHGRYRSSKILILTWNIQLYLWFKKSTVFLMGIGWLFVPFWRKVHKYLSICIVPLSDAFSGKNGVVWKKAANSARLKRLYKRFSYRQPSTTVFNKVLLIL